MNAPFAQTARMGRLMTDLGPDVLNLLTFTGEEHMNGLFHYRVEALATRDDLSFDDLIGTHATVHLKSFDQPETPYDGIIVEAEMLGQGDNGWRYALVLRPWLYLLGMRRKQQIYHEKTVVQILEEVFAPYASLGQPAVRNDLTGAYPTLEYTVQYRESDLAFATRLMERFGISYHFEHGDGTHALVLTDNVTAHADVPGGSRKYQHVAAGHRAKEAEHFWDMRPSQRLTTGKIRLTDYNFKTPDAAMEAERAGGAPYDEGEIESYDYPGDYLDQGTGKKVARLRVDQERGQDPRHRAVGDCASLRAGHLVKVTGDKVPNVGKSLCLSARHAYTSGGYGASEAGDPSYEGQYLLMPASAPLRPELKTPRAIVQGPQTARVVGEGEIDCDEYGRILVRFHWDLDNRYSMRCRVSQNWASKGWGGMVIPRIGMEVIVEFLEGDPDKPLVTGCVYNGKNEVPYALPAHKTKSVFRSDTHQGTGFNELTFEDEKGAEEIYLHAQKDQTVHIENNRAKRVDVNQFESVGHNKSIEIGNNHEEVVGGNMHLVVGANRLNKFISRVHTHFSNALLVKASKILGGASGLGMLGAAGLGKGNMSMNIGGNKSETVAVTSTETVGVNKASVVGGARQDYTGGSAHNFAGQHILDEAVRSISQVAGERWQAGSGKTSITLDAASGKITVLADDIEIEGRSSIKLKAPRIDIN